MKKFKLNLTKSARHGGVAFAITAIIIVIVIFLNLLIGQLPSSVLEFDFSDQHIYTVGSDARAFISDLDANVELILVAEESSIDERISKYVYNYAVLSSHIKVLEIDPVVNPSALETYACTANSLVVLNTDTGKMTAIPFTGDTSALILYTLDYNTYSYVENLFDAEGAITSAISYVTSDATAAVYELSGHGETALSSTVAGTIGKANLTLVSEHNILINGGIPEDCSTLICNNPTSDLSDDELLLIRDYLSNGGDMVLLMDSAALTNFNALISDYGLSVYPGYLGDFAQYYAQYAQSFSYFCIAPALGSSNLTSGINTNAMLIYPKAMNVSDPVRDTISVETFMTTTANGFYLDSQSSNPVQGTYTIGAVATEPTDNGTANLTVISAASLLDATVVDSFSNMSNIDIFMNAVTLGMDDISGATIPAKSLAMTYNTFTNYGLLALLFIAIIPLACLLCGLVIWLRRRKR